MLPVTEEIEITVAAASTSGIVDMRPETRLARAGLLYGDRVTVFSLFDDAISKLSDITQLDEAGLIDFMIEDARRRNAPGAGQTEDRLRRYQALRHKKHRTRAELLEVQTVGKQLKKMAEGLAENRARALQETGANDLYDLVGTGLVTVHSIDSGAPWGANPAALTEFLEAIAGHLAAGRSYAMLNPTVTGMLSPRLAAGEVIALHEAPARLARPSLAVDLLFRLPAIDTISVRDVISIREELQAPLLRFRSAVSDLAKEIEAAPWEPGFGNEAQELHDLKVAPALLEIDEAVRTNSWLSDLLAAVSKTTSIPSASAVGFLIAKASAVPDVLITALAAFVGAGLVANDAVRRWRTAESALRRNKLFYYWKLLQR